MPISIIKILAQELKGVIELTLLVMQATSEQLLFFVVCLKSGSLPGLFADKN